MAGLKLLKMRLENVKSIQKITSAMKLVSSVKFKKLEKKVLDAKDYPSNLEQSLLGYIQNRDEAHLFHMMPAPAILQIPDFGNLWEG